MPNRNRRIYRPRWDSSDDFIVSFLIGVGWAVAFTALAIEGQGGSAQLMIIAMALLVAGAVYAIAMDWLKRGDDGERIHRPTLRR